MYFELNGIKTTLASFASYNESVTNIEGSSIVTMSSGRNIKQTSWTDKKKVKISGTGFFPIGLAALPVAVEMTLKLAHPVSVSSSSNSITITANRRIDAGYEPQCAAIVDGDIIKMSHTVVGSTFNITPHGQAQAYVVTYVPQIQVFCIKPPTESSDKNFNISWSIDLIQV